MASGTDVTFTVTATNAVGTGAPSAASAPVSPLPATVPDAPLAVTAQPGAHRATVSWTAPADGGSPITGYTVVADPGGATATTTGATNATLTGLTDGTAYTVTVTATNAVGTGAAGAAGAAVTPGPDRLTAGQGLTAGQQLVSPNGRYRFVQQADGNAVVYGPGQRPLWYPRTWANPGAALVLQADGNVVVHAASGAVLWHADTWGHPGAGLVLQDDGNLVLYDTAGRALWFTGWDTAPAGTLFGLQQLTAGQALVSPAGRFTMVVQGDGNVVVYDSAQRALWSSRTWGQPGARLQMQADGNPVVYTASRQATWHPATYGNAGARLVVQDDGNLVVYAAGGRALWSSRYGRTY